MEQRQLNCLGSIINADFVWFLHLLSLLFKIVRWLAKHSGKFIFAQS